MKLYGFIDWRKVKSRLTPKMCGNIKGGSRLQTLRGAAMFISVILTIQSLTRIGFYTWKMANGGTIFDLEWIPWSPLVPIPANHTCFEVVPEVIQGAELVLTCLNVLTMSFNICLMFAVLSNNAHLLTQWISYTEVQIWVEIFADFFSLVAMFCPAYHFGIIFGVFICNIKAMVLSYFVWIVKSCHEELLEHKKKNRKEGKDTDIENTNKEVKACKVIIV